MSLWLWGLAWVFVAAAIASPVGWLLRRNRRSYPLAPRDVTGTRR